MGNTLEQRSCSAENNSNVAKGADNERWHCANNAPRNICGEDVMNMMRTNTSRHWNILLACFFVFLGGMPSTARAMTVYFLDGTTLEVDQIVKMGDVVYLTVDLSRIDTSRTPIQDIDALDDASQTRVIQQSGLSIENFAITPSEDQTELHISGDVSNHAGFPVNDVRVNITLQDKQGQKLLTVKGYVRPEKLADGETGSFSLHIRRPENFWKASADIQATSTQE